MRSHKSQLLVDVNNTLQTAPEENDKILSKN